MNTKLILLAGLSALAFTATAHAADVTGKSWDARERFQIRGRAIGVIPQESSWVNIGGDIKAGNDFVPEVDFTYFFTDNIAAELIAATSKHKFTHSGGSNLGTAWALPPTLTLQYHFMPHQAFSPYLGAGLNYTVFYNEKAAAGFTDFDVGNGVGWALQAGADYWINQNWGVNVDVKKIFVNVDASLNNGTINGDVDVDPWVVGAGVSYRF
jgi:outer membrane protein